MLYYVEPGNWPGSHLQNRIILTVCVRVNLLTVLPLLRSQLLVNA